MERKEVSSKMAYVVTIQNLKGGVGKTTLTAILGLGLAEKYRVLLIDLDSQTSLTQIFLSEETREKIIKESQTDNDPTVMAILRDKRPKIYTFSYTSVTKKTINVDIIPGSLTGHLDAVFEGKIPLRDPFVMKRYINTINNIYDFILIDNAPSDFLSLTPSLVASDYVLVPEDGTTEAFTAAQLFLSYALPKYIWTFSSTPKVLGVVLTKVRSSAERLLLKHNAQLEAYLEDFPQVKKYIHYRPLYFGADAKDPRDYILSSSKQFLADLIWSLDCIKAPIAEVYDKLFVVDKKLQPDIYAFLFKVLRNIPYELVRRILQNKPQASSF